MIRKYLIPYSFTRCLNKFIGEDSFRFAYLTPALLLCVVVETVTLPILPLITWLHWKDRERCISNGQGGLCKLEEMFRRKNILP